jgi:heme/copper-type cytochrome/quinol oxidase subunit 3
MDLASRNNVKKQLLWVALVSISMFFASMLSAFIVEKADVVNWKVFILPDQFEISTGIIILSSFLLFFYQTIT